MTRLSLSIPRKNIDRPKLMVSKSNPIPKNIYAKSLNNKKQGLNQKYMPRLSFYKNMTFKEIFHFNSSTNKTPETPSQECISNFVFTSYSSNIDDIIPHDDVLTNITHNRKEQEKENEQTVKSRSFFSKLFSCSFS